MGLFSSKPNIQKLKEAGDVEGLKTALEHKDLNVREDALDALSTIDSDEARKIVEAHCIKEGEYATKLLGKGLDSLKELRYKQARKHIDEALEHSPGYADAWYWKSYLEYMDKNNEKVSLQLVDRALELNPKHVMAWLHKAYLLGVKEYMEIITCCDRVLEIEPENVDSLQWKALTLSAIGNHSNAFDICEKAIDIEPNNAQLWQSMAMILETAGREGDLANACQKFIELAEPELLRAEINYADKMSLELLKAQVNITKIDYHLDLSVANALARSYIIFARINKP